MTRNAHECAYKRAREPEATNTPPGISKTATLRAVIHGILSDMVGIIATSGNLMTASKEICTRMGFKPTRDPYADWLGGGGTPAPVSAVYHSMTQSLVLGARVAADAAAVTARRLAGNTVALLAGVPVAPWQVQPYPEWCLARVVTVTDTTAGFEVFSGLPAGLHIDVRLFRNTAERLYLGTGIANEKSLEAEFIHPAELYGMWLHLHIVAGTQLQVSDFRATQTLKAANRKVRVSRRPDVRECPHSFAWDCYMCPMGTAECELACRMKKPPVSACKAGHDGFIEKGVLCITCAANDWRAQRGIAPLYLPPKIRRKENTNADNTTASTSTQRERHHLDVPVT